MHNTLFPQVRDVVEGVDYLLISLRCGDDSGLAVDDPALSTVMRGCPQLVSPPVGHEPDRTVWMSSLT